jgi:hypothetical protein
LTRAIGSVKGAQLRASPERRNTRRNDRLQDRKMREKLMVRLLHRSPKEYVQGEAIFGF